MTEKRFTINKSRMIDGAWVINDEDLRYAFTPQWSKKSLISTCNALNELADENEKLKQSIKMIIEIAEKDGVIGKHQLKTLKGDVE